MQKKLLNNKKKYSNLTYRWIFAISIITAIISAICVAPIIMYLEYGSFDLEKLLFEIIKVFWSTTLITIPLGIIAKIITDKLFSVDVNMKQMRKLGVSNIGDGISSQKDKNLMFGSNKPTKKYPYRLNLMFMTGKSFLEEFSNEIVNCMNEGCEIRLLIASYMENNREYLRRNAELHREDGVDYIKEITEQTLVYVQKIRDLSDNPENLKVRFYMDEYQNNIRIAKYMLGENEISHYWINLTPLNKCAKELSISLKGTVSTISKIDISNKNAETNLCLASETGFDILWNKYKYTEELAPIRLPL